MIIPTSTVLAIRCPRCGKLEFHTISLFSFSGSRTLEVKCFCGATLLTAQKRNNGFYRLLLPCAICDYKHMRQISGTQLWSGQLITLYCQESGMELAHIGSAERVHKAVQSYDDELDLLIRQFEDDDYFNNSAIMYEVINRLHDIAEKNGLYCQCGNDEIEVEIFPDRLELYCKDCNSVSIVYAETEEDLEVIINTDYIELTQHGFSFLDCWGNGDSKNNPKLKKPRRKHNKHR